MRSLAFFQERVVEELPGSFCTELWSRYLVMVATHESAIRHALVAVSALYEDYTTSLGQLEEFALRQYNHAIRHILRLDYSDATKAGDVILLICVIFFSFECLRGDFQAAMTHLCGGVKLLAEYMATGSAIDGAYIPRWLLRQLFVRMETQALEFDYTLPSERALPRPGMCKGQPLLKFASLSHAMLSMNQYLNKLLRFLRSAEGALRTHVSAEIRQQDELRRARFVQHFQQWCLALDRALDDERDAKLGADATLLQLYRKLVVIILHVNLGAEKPNFDEFCPEFAAITSLASGFLHLVSTAIPIQQAPNLEGNSGELPNYHLHRTSHPAVPAFRSHMDLGSVSSSSSRLLGIPPDATPVSSSRELLYQERSKPATHSSHGFPRVILPKTGTMFRPTYVTGLGIVMPLFVVCAWCPRRDIRAQALHLLLVCNRKEGVWDSSLAARMAEQFTTAA